MQLLIGFIKQLTAPLHKQAIATLVNFRHTVQQPLNVAGAGFVDDVAKLTVAVSV
jgi:hypothetical protein